MLRCKDMCDDIWYMMANCPCWLQFWRRIEVLCLEIISLLCIYMS